MTINLITEAKQQATNTRILGLVALLLAFLILGISLKTAKSTSFTNPMLGMLDRF